ncbi:MAG TPA: anthranilate synthase component I family protein [Opitutus sp.]|nr:anthranilate synthase component I family protein [Opitutus sp.]
MQPVRPDDWQRWRREGCTRLPATLVVRDTPPPSTWEAFAGGPATVLLESAQTGRYTYICDRPARLIIGGADHAEVRSADGATRLRRIPGKPLEILEALLNEARVPTLAGWPAMTGGLLGVLGYDLVHTWEKLPRTARRDLALPLYAMIETAGLFIYDHVERALGVVEWCPASADFDRAHESLRAALERWEGRAPLPPTFEPPTARTEAPRSPPPPSFTPAAFHAAVRRTLDYIAAGDTYQVNLSLRASRPAELDPTTIYESLRRINPSPYMGLLRLPEFALVCGSPELLVKLDPAGRIISRPIAGTRPRGEAPPQDSDLSAELFASPKERAEHLMLVDLIRNDIGRVAAYGSVQVSEFMGLERYSHVMHIVSQVEGQLAAGRTWADVFRAMFPGGTITGCPKIRTMEIIEELEPVGRGYYTGALGWVSYGGAMEMNIVIRSMLVQDGIAHVQAGAGVVADSQPERELDESLRKARALWDALAAAATSPAASTRNA